MPYETYFLSLSLYSGTEAWEGIWNQTHLVVLNFCLDRLHHVTISHDKVHSNRRCEWSELFRTEFNSCNQDSGLHWENYISIPFQSEWDMIVVTVFETNGNSIWFNNCYHDHIPFTVKGNGNIIFSVHAPAIVFLCK